MSTTPTLTKAEDVTVDFGFGLTLTGNLEHNDAAHTLTLWTDEGPETLSKDLSGYGVYPAPGCVFIKDWSEHEGLTARLRAAGIVGETQRTAVVGSFSTSAFEVPVTLNMIGVPPQEITVER